MSQVTETAIRKLLNFNFWGMHCSALCGFLSGTKICDYLFFTDEQYEGLREDMEDEFWAKNGKNHY